MRLIKYLLYYFACYREGNANDKSVMLHIEQANVGYHYSNIFKYRYLSPSNIYLKIKKNIYNGILLPLKHKCMRQNVNYNSLLQIL